MSSFSRKVEDEILGDNLQHWLLESTRIQHLPHPLVHQLTFWVDNGTHLSPTCAIGWNSIPSRINMPCCVHVVYLDSKAIDSLSRNLASSDRKPPKLNSKLSACVSAQEVPYIHARMAQQPRHYLRYISIENKNYGTYLVLSLFSWYASSAEHLKWFNYMSTGAWEPDFSCENVGQVKKEFATKSRKGSQQGAVYTAPFWDPFLDFAQIKEPDPTFFTNEKSGSNAPVLM